MGFESEVYICALKEEEEEAGNTRASCSLFEAKNLKNKRTQPAMNTG